MTKLTTKLIAHYTNMIAEATQLKVTYARLNYVKGLKIAERTIEHAQQRILTLTERNNQEAP